MMGVMVQRLTGVAAATRRELCALAARSPGCPWNRRSARSEPQHRPWPCLYGMSGTTRPYGRDTVTCSGLNRGHRSAFLAGQTYRRYCTSDGEPSRSDTRPDISVVGIPDPITWIRNTVHIYLIELYFELGLKTVEFDNGVKQALVHVSSRMSTGRFEELRGVVSSEMVAYAEQRCRSLTDVQRQQLSVCPDDIIFLMPEDVSVVFDQYGRKFCLIEIRFWFLSSAEGPEDTEATRIFRVDATPDDTPQKKIVTAVYEFHRELTRGAEPDWTVTSIWHWPWKQAE